MHGPEELELKLVKEADASNGTLDGADGQAAHSMPHQGKSARKLNKRTKR